jgi:hypothetical protein
MRRRCEGKINSAHTIRPVWQLKGKESERELIALNYFQKKLKGKYSKRERERERERAKVRQKQKAQAQKDQFKWVKCEVTVLDDCRREVEGGERIRTNTQATDFIFALLIVRKRFDHFSKSL